MRGDFSTALYSNSFEVVYSLCDFGCVTPTVCSKELRTSTSPMLKVCGKRRSSICSLRPAHSPSAFNSTPKRNRYAGVTCTKNITDTD